MLGRWGSFSKMRPSLPHCIWSCFCPSKCQVDIGCAILFWSFGLLVVYHYWKASNSSTLNPQYMTKGSERNLYVLVKSFFCFAVTINYLPQPPASPLYNVYNPLLRQNLIPTTGSTLDLIVYILQSLYFKKCCDKINSTAFWW